MTWRLVLVTVALTRNASCEKPLTVCEVLSTPALYHDKRIAVRGARMVTSETDALHPYQCILSAAGIVPTGVIPGIWLDGRRLGENSTSLTLGEAAMDRAASRLLTLRRPGELCIPVYTFRGVVRTVPRSPPAIRPPGVLTGFGQSGIYAAALTYDDVSDPECGKKMEATAATGTAGQRK